MRLPALTTTSLLLLALTTGHARADCAAFEVIGDGIPTPLGGHVGDAEAGRHAATDRARGDCSICHRLPLPNDRFHGNVGPDLNGVGSRLTPAQIRLRVAAHRRLNPHSVMPDYCTSGGRHRVADGFANQPILTAAEIEDIVAWLLTFKGNEP